jgi:2-keto-4-pentenoate hydratase
MLLDASSCDENNEYKNNLVTSRDCGPMLKTSSPLAWLATRVTRLGKFSTIGRLFTLGSVMKITEVAANLWATFSTVPFTYVLI